MKKFKISFSCMNVFDQCKYKFFLRYIKKIYPDIWSEYLDFGNIIHNVSELWKGGTKKELNELFLKVFKTPQGFKKDKKFHLPMNVYKPKIKKALNNVWHFYEDHLKDNEFFAEHELSIEKSKYELFGKIDLMYIKDDVLYVCDYKTSKATKDYSDQLAYYFYLLREDGYIEEDFLCCKLVYFCLDNQEDYHIQDYELNLEDLNTCKTNLVDFIKGKELRGTDETKWEKQTSGLCPYCDYYKNGDCKGKNK